MRNGSTVSLWLGGAARRRGIRSGESREGDREPEAGGPASFLILSVFLSLFCISLKAGADGKSLLILTGDLVKERSAKLDQFVAAKEARGFTVKVATESDYGAEGLAGQDRGLAIRAWLKNAAKDYRFLLIIADADPDYGDVPFLKVWPRHQFPEGQCAQFPIDCRSCVTDFLYAEITGDWDLNRNGQLGETELDDGPGGIEFESELMVGRIPVYFGEIDDVDVILAKTIAYMSQTQDQVAYRSRILLPAAFFYFRGQPMITKDDDGAAITEWFVRHALDGMPGITYTRLYEAEGVVPSAYDFERPLTEENLVDEWSKGYGMVFWAGHGLEKQVARTFWASDDNANDKADGDEVQQPLFIQSSDTANLPNDQPAFVVGVSCEIGSVEVPENLSWSLLAKGGAIGVIGSSSVTPGTLTDYAGDAADLDAANYGADNMGIVFFSSLIEGKTAGEAFFETKKTLGTAGGVEPYAGKLMLNYFGDPSLTLYDTADDAKPVEDAGTPDSGAGGSEARNEGSSGGCSVAGVGKTSRSLTVLDLYDLAI